MGRQLQSWLKQNNRRLGKAELLLRPAVSATGGVWADLGCGEGIFTYLLTTMLQPGSQIYAVDNSQAALLALRRHLTEFNQMVTVQPQLADFTRPLNLPPLDGMVMANSLHFVSAKRSVLVELVKLLKPGGAMVVVEYNTNRGNSAVPHPLDETQFLKLMAEIGLGQARIAARAPSTFLGEMYSGVAVKAWK